MSPPSIPNSQAKRSIPSPSIAEPQTITASSCLRLTIREKKMFGKGKQPQAIVRLRLRSWLVLKIVSCRHQSAMRSHPAGQKKHCDRHHRSTCLMTTGCRGGHVKSEYFFDDVNTCELVDSQVAQNSCSLLLRKKLSSVASSIRIVFCIHKAFKK